MRVNRHGSTAIMFKAVLKNIINIFRYYPKMIFMASHTDRYSNQEMYSYSQKLIHALIDTCNIQINVTGLENIPSEDGFYICSNHQEKFDPLAIWYSFPRYVGCILNDEVTHRPFISEVCRLIKTKKLSMDLHAVVKIYREITEELNSGANYMIFPEGAYEEDVRQLSYFHSGCFKSPKRANCIILPVALINSYCIFDKGFKTTKPLEVHYLKPVYPEEYAGLSTDEIAKLVQSRIQNEVNQYQL